MSNHYCEYIIDFDMDGDGDPIFCDKVARFKLDSEWLCADHYDQVISDDPF